MNQIFGLGEGPFQEEYDYQTGEYRSTSRGYQGQRKPPSGPPKWRPSYPPMTDDSQVPAPFYGPHHNSGHSHFASSCTLNPIQQYIQGFFAHSRPSENIHPRDQQYHGSYGGNFYAPYNGGMQPSWSQSQCAFAAQQPFPGGHQTGPQGFGQTNQGIVNSPSPSYPSSSNNSSPRPGQSSIQPCYGQSPPGSWGIGPYNPPPAPQLPGAVYVVQAQYSGYCTHEDVRQGWCQTCRCEVTNIPVNR